MTSFPILYFGAILLVLRAHGAGAWVAWSWQSALLLKRGRQNPSRHSSILRAGPVSSQTTMLQLIERKKYEIAQLEKVHAEPFDPLRMRLGYVAEDSSLALTRALRLFTLVSCSPLHVELE